MFQLFAQILDWVCGFFTMALLARFLMQWTRAPFRNPIGEFVVALTDWAVRPARRLIPSSYGMDLASLLLAWLAQATFQGILFALGGIFDLTAIGALALLALIETLRVGVYLLMGVVIVSALLSWVNPYAPLAPVFNIIARPFLRPLQSLIPLIGGVDLSPMVLLLILQVLLRLLDSVHPLIFRWTG
jgi:YggT family protein